MILKLWTLLRIWGINFQRTSQSSSFTITCIMPSPQTMLTAGFELKQACNWTSRYWNALLKGYRILDWTRSVVKSISPGGHASRVQVLSSEKGNVKVHYCFFARGRTKGNACFPFVSFFDFYSIWFKFKKSNLY